MSPPIFQLSWSDYDIACEHKLGGHWNHFIRGMTGIDNVSNYKQAGYLTQDYGLFGHNHWDR